MASSPVTEHEHALPETAAVPPTGWGLFWGALKVAAILLLVGALAWLIFGFGTGNFVSSDAKRAAERAKILADRNTEDAKLLHDRASWQDKGKGLVRVPIEEAMKMTVEDLKESKPQKAYPLKQSPPQPANAPTAANTKGPEVADASAGVNPPASNPTVGQPSPAPGAAAPTPAPPAPAASAPAPAASAPAPAAPATGAQSAPPPAPSAQPAPTSAPASGEQTTPAPAPSESGAKPAGTP